MKAISAVNSLPSPAVAAADGSLQPEAPCQSGPESQGPDPVLCGHCGRTASNGLVCIGMCVADSGY
jgi:hypothetical protein